jgi:hypothetical protein
MYALFNRNFVITIVTIIKWILEYIIFTIHYILSFF